MPHDCLEEWVSKYRPYAAEGRLATYIPALARANPSHLGICIVGPDGTTVKAGDSEIHFTLQSISKVLSFMTACLGHGIPYVLERVDVEPTGDAFNSIVRLEIHKPGKPFNPMINAGAITVASMLPGKVPSVKLDALLSLMEQMIGRRPAVNEEVFESEWKTAYRNRALAYYLRETGFLECEVEDAMEVYLKQCSVEFTTEDLAIVGLVLAHDGYNPLQKEQVVSKEIARLTKALMLTCGMYNASGKFAAFVGVPAKSGVSGGILASALPRIKSRSLPFPDGCGIGIYGPAVDDVGNSRAGGLLLKHIAEEWDLSIF